MRWFIEILAFFAVLSSASSAAKNFRWCTVNADEERKCNDFKAALPGLAKMAGVDITPGCVSGIDDEDCMKKIRDNKADFITLDGGKIYLAGKCYDLVPIVAESYGPPEGISYYAVAVARKNTNIDFKSLKGRKSCHTGYRKTAGWNMPVGRLLEEMIMDNKGDDAKSASAFFSQSCVPGVPKGYDNLCQLCPQGLSDCSSDSNKNKYSGYHGAFKCMADNKGEVAFVKHLTTGEMVKEPGYLGNMSDYKYLCTDGTSQVVTADSHETCNLASNPSHAVLGRAGENADFVKVLLKASVYCQPSTTASSCSNFLIFDSKKYGSGKKDLLFKDSTKKLVDVKNRNTYKAWLGDGYVKAVEALGNIKCAANPVTATPIPTSSVTATSRSNARRTPKIPVTSAGAINTNPLPTLLAVLVFFIKTIL